MMRLLSGHGPFGPCHRRCAPTGWPDRRWCNAGAPAGE